MPNCVHTRAGKTMDIQRPSLAAVDPRDFAHSLSRQCRFNGHTRRWYSVAEHCVLGSYLVPADDALPFLLHDASEVYIGDIPTTVKNEVPYIRVLEARISRTIAEWFGLPTLHTANVETIDKMLVHYEASVLMPWSTWYDKSIAAKLNGRLKLELWTPKVASAKYTARLTELLTQESNK